MRILLTNDDGIHAAGLAALERALAAVGEVWTVAPDQERSAVSHAITLGAPLRITEVGERRFVVNGTPTDCTYLALNHMVQDEPPALLISGVNHGPNLGNDVTYSGTVGAAMEGCGLGVPSMAVSSVGTRASDLDGAAAFTTLLAIQVAERSLPPGVFLNVNVPEGFDTGEAPRWQVTTLGRRNYGRHVDMRLDPRGGRYFWIGGPPITHDDIPGSDCNAVRDGAASVTPVHMDLTRYEYIRTLQSWTIDGSRPTA